MGDLDNEWKMFLDNIYISSPPKKELVHDVAPKPTPIYISTKTVISFLNECINLGDTFWKIPVISYTTPTIGVIKKQLKINSCTVDEVTLIDDKIQQCEYGYSTIMQHVETLRGDIAKYKDVRKVTIGISKKDILSSRIKKRGAFYNCFVLIIRIKTINKFKEFHVKVFNTGKIEIPGIQDKTHIKYITDVLLDTLRIYYPNIVYNKSLEETILINSNFNCGFYINRGSLYQILRKKYNISAVYDSSSYPGIQCKIYYNDKVVTTIESIVVSFMIFRTGSVLIVGKCPDHVIHAIYDYLTIILRDEYKNIVDMNSVHINKVVSTKTIKRSILINNKQYKSKTYC